MSQTPGTRADQRPIRYRTTLLRAGRLCLDAGCMLGLIPKVVWSRSIPVDERNRMTLMHNCLLLERLDDAPGGRDAPKLVLLETGTGEKLDAKSRELFSLDDRTILTALDEAQCNPTDIGAVIPSHLHFDHAGGLTRLVRPGETPDWTGPASSMGGSRGAHGVKLAFPNATVFTQAREWADALANRSVMTRTYFADHLEPYRDVASDRLSLVDSPPPHAPGVAVDRETRPLPSHARETEVLPGIFVFRVPGHTWGQQATRFVDHKGRSVVFVPDVMPTRWHAGQAYSLAYDVEPYTSMLTRTWLLEEAAENGWLLLLDHEPGEPFFSVKRDGKGWFTLEPAGG